MIRRPNSSPRWAAFLGSHHRSYTKLGGHAKWITLLNACATRPVPRRSLVPSPASNPLVGRCGQSRSIADAFGSLLPAKSRLCVTALGMAGMFVVAVRHGATWLSARSSSRPSPLRTPTWSVGIRARWLPAATWPLAWGGSCRSASTCPSAPWVPRRTPS